MCTGGASYRARERRAALALVAPTLAAHSHAFRTYTRRASSSLSPYPISQEEKLAVRTFFRKSRRLFKRRSYVDLIDNCLSPELKDDVRYSISSKLFACVW